MRIESNLPNAPIGNTPSSTVALSRPGFSKAMELAQQPATPSVRSIKPGDTLTGIVREQAQISGVKLTPSEEFRWTQALANDNGIQNANAIFPGQKIQLQNMLSQWQAGQTQPQGLAQNSSNAINTKTAKTNEAIPTIVVTAARPTTSLHKANYINAVAHPVLSKTLDRAVARGFIPKVEQQDVYNKVLQVANKHKFSPDDFARLTLMESDGMNPQATNTRCHGIIQFCDGRDRGAAVAGFANNPKAILGHSVFQQLDLVEKYFDHNGLKSMGPTNLDDLYLTVLTPAARREKAPNVDLNIAGTQAKKLYVNRDPSTFITRNSIVQGLHQHANERLGLYETAKAQAQKLAQALTNISPPVQVATNQQRAQALRVGAYLNQEYLR